MISVRSISKSYGAAQVLREVSFEIQSGEIVVLQGPSGSGKTTLLRLLAGLELPDSGEIWLDGQPALLPPSQRGIGMVFQRSALWPHLNVTQNILFAMNGAGRREKTDRLDELSGALELTALLKRYPAQLSGGEARLVALARALAAWPRRLFLDEPLTSLDAELRGRALAVVLDYHRRAGATILFVTHIQEEADEIGGRRLRLEAGRLAV
jgi:ABC-type sugar transport system ATPase subunit